MNLAHVLSLKDPTDTNDCTVVALTLVTGERYCDVYIALELAGREHRKGATTSQMLQALDILGYKIKRTIEPYLVLKTGVKRFSMKTIGLKYPTGKFVGITRTHAFALLDGTVEDWHKDRRFIVSELWELESL